MSDDFADYSDWAPSGEGLEGLEDKDFEFFVEEVESAPVEEYSGPCGGCTRCATGASPLGADFENKEACLDIVEVEFKANRTAFYVNEASVYLQPESRVIVQGDHGIELGRVVATGETVRQKRRSQGTVGQAMGKILRLANDRDLEHLSEIARLENEAVPVFKEKCSKHNLPMKLAAVEFQLDRSRLTFYFTADRRIDFRALVRDLAGVYRTRIELRQIGARDEAKKLGGVGTCGREVCCVAWMTRLCRVNVDYARFQNLSLSPSRLAGACGRLKCCILFEHKNYLGALEKFPEINSKMITAKGSCSIERVDIFNERVFVKYQETGVVESVGLDELKLHQSAGVRQEIVKGAQNH